MFLQNSPPHDLWHIIAQDARPKLIYGMGDGADKLISRLEHLGIPYADVFASDEFVRGQTFHGREVFTLKRAEELYGDFVVLVSFATHLPEVISHISAIAKRHTLYVPDMPAYGDTYFDHAFFTLHKAELAQAQALFSDTRSKEVFSAIVLGKLTGDLDTLLACADDPQIIFDILGAKDFMCAIDAGAYTGDTVRALLPHAPHLKHIYAIEPDPHTFRRLSTYAAGETSTEIHLVEGAVWSCETTLSFSGKGNRGSSAKRQGKTVEVKTVMLDRLDIPFAVDYVKFDVEGAEYEALLGAKQLLLTHRPAVLLSLYHRAEDLYRLPLLLAELCPDYDFYLRRPPCLPAWEINLLAIPKEKRGKTK